MSTLILAQLCSPRINCKMQCILTWRKKLKLNKSEIKAYISKVIYTYKIQQFFSINLIKKQNVN